ncbi:hypothetical protein M8J76_003009 [Diaphorina citri]|nr:hypothetical protein M8J75_015481 [Diaphorina citri]KAI5726453.1 hypothetical protein M8J76_003009 [Diaphorina citri]
MSESLGGLSDLATYLGAGVLIFLVLDALYNFVNGVRIHFLNTGVDLKEKYGDWAVVTGCTDGIGRAYAHELARRGINIVLISRTLEKLKKTAKEIESLHGVQTKIIAVDLSGTKAAIEAVKNQLGDHPVHILVNNVGSLSSYPKSLTEDTEKETWDTLSLNVVFTTLMTKLILPRMKDNGRGAIVNVSSISEASPWALFNVYAATKIYVKYFTEGLRIEYENSGLTFQLLSPGLVSSKMTDFNPSGQKSKLLSATPEQFARSAVKTLGVTDTTTGYWLHGFQYFFVQRLPLWLLKRWGYSFNKYVLRNYKKDLAAQNKSDKKE